MRSLPYWFIGLSTIFAIVGMALGIYMAASQDHVLAPAHAHNNLLGFVAMALYGLYYKAVPVAANSRLALVHFWLAFAGALTLGPGVGLAVTGKGEMLASASSIIVLLSMLLFAYIVWTFRQGLKAE
jgi:phosphatidylglycerophosphate synthase